MSISAIVENDIIKLPVHVPDGTRVDIVLPVEETEMDFDCWLAGRRGHGGENV